jgi:hypothetical protein
MARAGWTEGQVWTAAIGFILAAILLGAGIPSALRHEVTTGEHSLLPSLFRDAQPQSAPSTAAGSDGTPAAPPAVVLDTALPADITTAPSATTPLALPFAVATLAPPPVADNPVPSPLRVVASGWATTGPTPGQIGDPTVPAGTLPVSARAGRLDKLSFLRFTGAMGLLKLTPATGSALTQQDVASAAVQACTITTAGWAAPEGGSVDTAPQYDCAGAQPLAPQPDGSWIVDLSRLSPAAATNGVALVPVATGVTTFQIVYARPR